MTTEAGPRIHECECDVCQAGSDTTMMHYHQQMNLLLSRLNQAQRRWYVAVISQAPDSLSDRQLSQITGLDEKTIRRGRQELDAKLVDQPIDGQRREGGGRRLAEKKTRR